MILVLILYIFFAITFILAKGVVSYIQPIFFVGARMILGGICLIGYQYLRNRVACWVNKEDWITFAQVAFFHIFVSYVGEFWGIQFISASKASLLFNLSPFITALLSAVLLSEKLSFRQWIALVIGFIGFVPILMSQNAQEALSAHVGFISSAEIALLISVVSAAYGWIVIKRLMDKGYTSITINGYAMFFGGVLSLIASFLMEPVSDIVIPSTNPQWGLSSYNYAIAMIIWYSAALIITANFIAYPLYSWLLTRYSATFLSFAGFTIPIFTAVLDWLIFGNLVGISFIVSTVCVTGALVLFYLDEKK